MKETKTILTAMGFSLLLLSFGNNANNKPKKIGTQIWTVANLDVSTFKNGDAIPEAKTADEWVKAGDNGQPAWCYYDNDPINGKKYGKIYNWFAVRDPRGLAPDGWHVPNDKEWEILIDYLGGEKNSSEKMKTTKGWKGSDNGTNISGFSALPGGCRYFYGGFNNIGSNGYWWSSTEGKVSIAWDRGLTSNKGFVNGVDYDGRAGYSVRCIKD